MGVKRYELDEAQWARIAPLLPGKASDPGRTGSDNRLFVNGVLWVLRSGTHLAGPSRALRQVEDGAQALQPLGGGRGLGEGLRRSRRGPGQPVSDAGFDPGQGAPAGDDRSRQRLKKGGARSGCGAFPRRTDHQGPHGLRHVRSARPGPDRTGAEPRHSRCPGASLGPQTHRRPRRQGL